MVNPRMIDGISGYMFGELNEEYKKAVAMYKPFHSAHEGFAILLEEVEELKREVFVRQSQHNYSKMRKEAIQVATMAIRFAYDICGGSIKR